MAELAPVGNVKWLGDELLALEGAAHSVRLLVAEVHYAGARYDYRITWGDGSAGFSPARTAAMTLTASHRYGPAGSVYPLVASVADAARGETHTIRADVRVVTRAVYDQPTLSIRVSPAEVVFQAIRGAENPPPRAAGLTNAGGAPVSWSATTDAAWLDGEPRCRDRGSGRDDDPGGRGVAAGAGGWWPYGQRGDLGARPRPYPLQPTMTRV